MLYLIYCEDRPGGAAIRQAEREAHFAYLANLTLSHYIT